MRFIAYISKSNLAEAIKGYKLLFPIIGFFGCMYQATESHLEKTLDFTAWIDDIP